ncbi:hypothetical protein [Streptomyces sp. GESEQ-13]|uniref:hypothetical protein n=1 Tax=Streptomyces sp. GESEQ-13 TaxID=2812654 RepID=UPI001B341693
MARTARRGTPRLHFDEPPDPDEAAALDDARTTASGPAAVLVTFCEDQSEVYGKGTGEGDGVRCLSLPGP